MTDKRKLLAEAILPLIELDARDFFDNYATGEGHVGRRWNILKEALSPAKPSQGWRVRESHKWGQVMERDPNEDPPIFANDAFQANYDDVKGKALIERAYSGDAEAEAALCEIIFQHIWRGLKLPFNLKVFLMVVLRSRYEAPPERTRQFSMDKNFERNFCIVTLVSKLSSCGFAPTRNRAAQDKDGQPSGCSIVAEALTRIGKAITERAVEEVWADRDKYVPPEPDQSSGMTKVR